MKSFIYPEMMTHIALCTNKDPKNVLIISNNAELLTKEIQKHENISSDIVDCNLNNLQNLNDNNYDVVICEMDANITLLKQIDRLLKDDGQLVLNSIDLNEVKKNKALMQLLGYFFKVIMPYNLGNSQRALLSSKEYHPTADIILQRADMLDSLNYYNCDIHIAAFAMPNYIRKEYLGFIKN